MQHCGAQCSVGFAGFLVSDKTRTPAEILAHLGDLIEGSHYLLQGKFVSLASDPNPWDQEVTRFYSAVRDLDTFLASEEPLAHPVEKFVQGPIGDALTHVGQIVMLRRIFGSPIRQEAYFTVDLTTGIF